MNKDQQYIRRCFELARRGAGHVSPNPLVGAVLVHNGRVIGEGWHQRYGEAHAEVNAFNAVKPADRHLIPESTLYCNLEPCFHHGRTPPCVERVLKERVQRVVVSNIDPFPEVAGRSVEKMRAAGVEVSTGILESEGAELNKIFFHWLRTQRPYIVLKWARSADGFIGRVGERTPITGPVAQRLVHRWRSELDAVLVGTRTAVIDNPRLDARLVLGRAPLRIALDARAAIPESHHLLDDSQPTWILGPACSGNWQNTRFYDVPPTWDDLLDKMAEQKITSLLVEGGTALLQQFIHQGLWNEIRVLTNPELVLGDGVKAPVIPAGAVKKVVDRIGGDVFEVIRWHADTHK